MPDKIPKQTIPGDKIIFIVEDNEVYAKALQSFIVSQFPDVKEVKTFSIGEMSLMEMYRNPGIVIMDYFLNSKFSEAHNGLEIIEQIKTHNPLTNIIVLSSQSDRNIVLDAISLFDCSYVQKGEEAFNTIEKTIRKLFSRDNTPPAPWN
jgi:DNA-binding NarL/FixJ family response regulator